MNPEANNPTPNDGPNANWPGVRDLAPADPNEPQEPGESHRPISVWVVAFMGLVLFWGGAHLTGYSGAFKALIYNEKDSGRGAPAASAPAPVDPYVLGARLFADTCAKCHQPNGEGLPGQYPPLAQSEWVLASGPDRMIRIVLDAMQGPVTVKGVVYNNTMTPWRDSLNDQQIAAIITYVRTHKEWGHKASAVTPEQVAAVRKATADRIAKGPWTAEELLAIPEHGAAPQATQ